MDVKTAECSNVFQVRSCWYFLAADYFLVLQSGAYTGVLKGHIAIHSAVLPESTIGAQFNVPANIWLIFSLSCLRKICGSPYSMAPDMGLAHFELAQKPAFVLQWYLSCSKTRHHLRAIVSISATSAFRHPIKLRARRPPQQFNLFG